MDTTEPGGREAQPVEPVITEEQALHWLTTNTWAEEVIADARGNRLASRRVFGSDQRATGSLLPSLPANVVAFRAIDVVLQAVQGAAGVARRLSGEILGVAVPAERPPARSLSGETPGVAVPAERPPARPPEHEVGEPCHRRSMAAAAPLPEARGDLAARPTAVSIKKGEARARCSFVVENATSRTLHNVAFKLPFLASGSGSTIHSGCVSFKPPIFELPPHGSQKVTVTIRTADARAGRYVGLAEAGRFRQVVSLTIA